MVTRKTTRDRSRRKLGRGQFPNRGLVNTTIVHSGSTAVLTFDKPANIKGNIPLTVGTRTFVGQVVNSPTQVTITMSGATTGLAYDLPIATPEITGAGGEVCSGAAGTFP